MGEQSAFARYIRQIQIEEFGEEGQVKLRDSTVVLVGCGGLGTVISNYLVRAGVGEIIIIDPDIVELDNLQRQVLFDEEDVRLNLPKAEAAARKLRKVNSQVSIKPLIAKLSSGNIESVLNKADIVFDGTDDMKTRFIINDACIKLNIPWIYGGVVATYGTSFTIIPNETPCFRCFIEDLPSPGDIPKCREVGVLGSAVSMIASIELTEGLKILTGQKEALIGKLVNVDAWSGSWELFEIERRAGCPACDKHKFEFLSE